MNPLGILVFSGQGVPVGDEKETLIFMLEFFPVGQGPVQVAQMQVPRWAHAA